MARIAEAAQRGAQVVCLQELFHGPYFAAEQDIKWYRTAEPVPGPITERMAPLAKKHRMVMIVPVYEMEQEGVYYNTAQVIDADGKYLGKMRKVHIPHTYPAFWEKFYFKPGTLGFPVFQTAYARIGIYICYDRHFPECARILSLKGAEILFNPSATTEGKSKYLWELEQPAQAVANGVFIGANNRVGAAPRAFVGEFAGASTTLASIGADPRQALAIQQRLMEDLALGVPAIGWHAARDRFAELGSLLAMVAATMGKIAHEVILLQKSEVMELEEPHHHGKVGSSTMSHKRNPMICEGIMAQARLTRSLLPALLESMATAEHPECRAALVIASLKRSRRSRRTSMPSLKLSTALGDSFCGLKRHVVAPRYHNEQPYPGLNDGRSHGVRAQDGVLFLLDSDPVATHG